MQSAIKKAIVAEIKKQFPGADKVKGLFNLDILQVHIGTSVFETTLRDKVKRDEVCKYFQLQRIDSIVVILAGAGIIKIIGDKEITL